MKRVIGKLTVSGVLLVLGFLLAQATTASSQLRIERDMPRVRLADCATHFQKKQGHHDYRCDFRFFPKCKSGYHADGFQIVSAGRYKVVRYVCVGPPR